MNFLDVLELVDEVVGVAAIQQNSFADLVVLVFLLVEKEVKTRDQFVYVQAVYLLRLLLEWHCEHFSVQVLCHLLYLPVPVH